MSHLNKEKSYTPNYSPQSHYFLLIFCLKESSQRDLFEPVKISFIKKITLFSVADTLTLRGKCRAHDEKSFSHRIVGLETWWHFLLRKYF